MSVGRIGEALPTLDVNEEPRKIIICQDRAHDDSVCRDRPLATRRRFFARPMRMSDNFLGDVGGMFFKLSGSAGCLPTGCGGLRVAVRGSVECHPIGHPAVAASRSRSLGRLGGTPLPEGCANFYMQLRRSQPDARRPVDGWTTWQRTDVLRRMVLLTWLPMAGLGNRLEAHWGKWAWEGSRFHIKGLFGNWQEPEFQEMSLGRGRAGPRTQGGPNCHFQVGAYSRIERS